MVEWQTELGDVNEALLAIERSKARSLLDELSRPGVDMELGRSSREREELRRREDQIKAHITGLEKQIEVLAGDENSAAADREEKQQQLKTELTAAQ